MKKTLYIFGAGGFGKEVLDIVRAGYQDTYKHVAFLDDGVENGTTIVNTKVEGGMDTARALSPETCEFVIALGSPALRKRLTHMIADMGHSFATLIDPTAIIQPSATIGEGTIVLPRVVVSSAAHIGQHCLLNIGAIVGHDVKMDDFVVVSPAAVLLGNTYFAEGVEVGSSATLYPGIKVGAWAKIAMCSAVYKDVPEEATVAGTPARIMRIKKDS
ncbi:MAG: hypothetical protein CL932_10845 [Deltaproteobacteria bacterium]|nr:hypothetical protein [Deltaproteobacteria bacterium]MBK05265.1 hypothetical protein [Deltaproteobacteria bacterium]|tara:strand:- start:5313 stop:5960 length:648 start_codon:yes stop_codon:yes gene_type:complete